MEMLQPGAAVPPLEGHRPARYDLVAVANALIAEFAGLLPADAVVRRVGDAREQLLAAGVRAGLAIAVESTARSRLLALVPPHGGAG